MSVFSRNTEDRLGPIAPAFFDFVIQKDVYE